MDNMGEGEGAKEGHTADSLDSSAKLKAMSEQLFRISKGHKLP